MRVIAFAAGTALFMAASAAAQLVDVQVVGTVEFNISNPNNPNTNQNILGIQPGERLTYSFQVDSAVFADSGLFNVRGYEIIESSFLVTTSGGFSTSMVNPLPGGATPYFVVRNNDPAVDGFYLTWGGVNFPAGLPIEENGLFGDPFEAHFSVGYDGGTLNSLDILDAEGTYGYGSGGPGTLTNFYFNLVDLGFEVVGVSFDELTITVVPAPPIIALLAGSTLIGRRRRR
jgi:hypothetical protein